jgi:hypothetical protein
MQTAGLAIRIAARKLADDWDGTPGIAAISLTGSLILHAAPR